MLSISSVFGLEKGLNMWLIFGDFYERYLCRVGDKKQRFSHVMHIISIFFTRTDFIKYD